MNIKKLLLYILITIFIGGFFGFFIMNDSNSYNDLIKPALTPASTIFPIVWTILYILMGVSLYLISQSKGDKEKSYQIYFAQLVFNSLWTLIFFGLNMKLLSIIWIIVLIILVILMIKHFYKINKLAAFLQIPYLFWLLFALYLSIQIFLLN